MILIFKRKFISLFILSAFMLSAIPAQANWAWLSNTPVSKFNDDDWDLLKKAARDLLDNGNDGDIKEWENPDTGNSGKTKIISTSNSDGKKCRKIAFKNNASFYGLSGQQLHRLCRQKDGTWKVEN